MATGRGRTKVTTIIRPCSCAHAWQDKRHGKGQRVHVRVEYATGSPDERCTVCKVKRFGGVTGYLWSVQAWNGRLPNGKTFKA